MTTITHYIAGHSVTGRSGRDSPVFNPATGEETGRVSGRSCAEWRSSDFL